MGFIEKTFNLKKCARALHRQPNAPESKLNPDTLTPKDLIPCLQQAYIQVLRKDKITISGLDFGAIGDGDIDDLENVLYYSPANDLFEISDIFKQFEPSCAVKRVFI